MSDIPRRSFLAVAGGGLAGAWLLADAGHLQATAEYVARLRGAPVFEVLTAEEAAVLDAAAAQIIPSDDTPGAREARVVNFIDRSIATWAEEQRPVMRKLVRELNSRARRVNRQARTFAALSEAEQHRVIESLEKDRHESFFALRGATIVGMLANPEYGGNHQKSGWRMLGFVDQFSWSAPFGHYDR